MRATNCISRCLWVAAAFAVGVPSAGRAQVIYFAAGPAWSSGPTESTQGVCAGDVDNDGYVDLVFGNDGGSNTLYRNAAGVVATTPAWSSQPAARTKAVALGDVDGDGDLDLVCGNDGESNTLYLNTGGVFAATPAWSSQPSNRTWSVALGDIDGDGDLDLVCGNYGANTLYVNEGGVFATAPAWASDLAASTRSVALGDIDGDGDLDVACGNVAGSNTVYLGVGGVLAAAPAWASGPAKWTLSVALGDVDGDGRLDLACGNNADSNTVYLGPGIAMSTTPAWSSDASDQTFAVALSDVDGDGDLDLVCGNNNQSNTLYVNAGGGALATTPAWSSDAAEPTAGVVLTDVDGDGAPEVVCANADRSNVYYRNERGSLSASPVWSNPSSDDVTRAVALGDVDGDGRLDLVCGNEGRVNTLYLNPGGAFATTPAWTSPLVNDTYGVALGDVDGDGDLDLVCGNFDQGNTLYRNDDGVFATTPAWTSGPANATRSVALGDIDGDGDLDLVCGNDESDRGDGSQHNTLYRNDGGVFTPTPVWLSGPAGATWSVVLGDIDGDGDLDLVCGNDGQSNALYRNDAGAFTPAPAWTSGPANGTRSVALGDIDGDGDPDLVCGNAFQSNTVFLNGPGGLAVTPAWSSSGLNVTQSIAAADIDGDGDIDVACGNTQGPNTLYRNDAGTLSAAPAWTTFPAALSTYGVALGDVDNDGDLDLVCGNAPQDNTVYAGLRNPPFTGDPLAPASQLPDNAAWLRDVTVTSSSSGNRYPIVFSAFDVESDPLWIVPEYQFSGDPTWRVADVAGAQPLESSPSGVRDSLQWDVSLIPFDGRDVVLRLRAVELPSRVAGSAPVSSYLRDVGPVVPIRPKVETAIGLLDFPTVTAGDTVSLTLGITNRGTAELLASDIELPSNEMSIGTPPPLRIAAGETISVPVLVHPLLGADIAGDLRIDSNDPLDPSHAVAVHTDIRGLNMVSRLIAGPDGVTLGEALTVVVTPTPLDTRIETGTLHYSIPGAGEYATPLFPSGNDFVGVIPAEHVTEAGAAYYVEVRNLPVVTFDPTQAPDSLYTVSVPAPAEVSALPQPNSGGGFLEDREIRVLLDVERGTVLDSACVHYRSGGERDAGYDLARVDFTAPIPAAVIPAGAVGPTGIEYWLEVFTLTRRLTDPPTNPAVSPRVLRVVVPNLAETQTSPGGTYRIVTIPLEFAEDFTGSLEALLSDQPEFGSYDPTRWRAWTYLGASGGYGELSDPSMVDRFRPEPGRAWWLIGARSNRIATAPIAGTSVSTAEPYGIELPAGEWTMVGCPFAFPVGWDSVRVDTTRFDDAVGVLVEPPLSWNGGYTAVTGSMEPFAGYWVYNRTDRALTLRVPPVASAPTAPAAPPPGPPPTAGWRLSLAARAAGRSSAATVVGEEGGARKGLDRYDRITPPPTPRGDTELYAISNSRRLAADIRPLGDLATDRGDVWSLDVARPSDGAGSVDELSLVVAAIDDLPEGWRAVLIDTDLGRRVELGSGTEYVFYDGGSGYATSEAGARFRLLAGTGRFVDEAASELAAPPRRAALHPNHPNPFNPGTVIRYDVAEPGRVSLRIYDVRGALVRVLEERYREPGRYDVGWDGSNDHGRRVSSGVYFCRMTAPGFARSRKMVVLK